MAETGRSGEREILDSAAQLRGEQLLREAAGGIRDAFAALELGWTYDDVEQYLLGSPSYQAMLVKLGGDQHGLLQGLIMGFALVAVEKGREGRGESGFVEQLKALYHRCEGERDRYKAKAIQLEWLVREAALFVNAVAAMAEDKGPALSWIGKAATVLPRTLGASSDAIP